MRAVAFSVLAGALAASTGTATARHAGSAGEIVFVSDAASSGAGEIYSLAAGTGPRDVSNSPYQDLYVAVSPRGNSIVYWSDRGGAWRLFVARPDGRGAHSLAASTTSSAPGGVPVFSPDGAQLFVPGWAGNGALVETTTGAARVLPAACALAVVSWAPDSRRLSCANGPRVEVFDLGGRRLHAYPASAAVWGPGDRLAVATATSTLVFDAGGRLLVRYRGGAVAWSRDGHTLAVSSPGRIELVDPLRRRTVRVIRGLKTWRSGAQLTPDGRYVTYTAPAGLPRIEPVKGGASRVLPSFGGTWSSTGRYAYLRLLPGSKVAVEIADELGRRAREAARFPFDPYAWNQLVWLRDGSRVLFAVSARPHNELWAVNDDGSGLRRLTANGLDIEAPAWSRDGDRLAYTAAARAGACGYCSSRKVVIADPRGRRIARLTPPGADDLQPSWAPSRRRIAVLACCDGDIVVVNVADRSRKTLLRRAGSAVAWSPDGGTIAYAGRGRISGVNPATAGTRTLVAATPDGADPTDVSWSPDGKLLAYTTKAGNLYVVAIAALDRSRLVATHAAGAVSFAPDSRRIAFATTAHATEENPTDLAVVNVDGSGLRPLVTRPFADAQPAWRG